MTLAATYDIEIAARTTWMEARNQGEAGMRAVAWAIVNRHDMGKWYSGETIADCCLKPYQFSAWNTTDPNRSKAACIADNDPILALCRGYVQAAMLHIGEDPTGGATHYANLNVCSPPWVNGATNTVTIADHTFYKNVA